MSNSELTMQSDRRDPGAGPSTRPLISIVVPCFNEEQSLHTLHRELTKAMATRPDVDCEFVLVNDGSSDRTAEILEELAIADPRVMAITLSRNFGQQPAISAGLTRAVTRASSPSRSSIWMKSASVGVLMAES